MDRNSPRPLGKKKFLNRCSDTLYLGKVKACPDLGKDIFVLKQSATDAEAGCCPVDFAKGLSLAVTPFLNCTCWHTIEHKLIDLLHT